MTILFHEDWDKVPSAIIDTKTTNISFLDMASKYRMMGIKNNAFPLQLHNPDLQGIDVFDENLDQETRLLIALECKNNIFYFIRECVRVPGGSYDDPITLKANRGNMTLFWLFMSHVMLFLVQPRQTGKSFSTDVLMRYLLNVRCTNTHINLLTKDDTLRSANLERLKNLELELPTYLKQRTRLDLANSEELTIKALGNRYRGHLPNRSPKLASNVGRGLTSPIFQVDEAAFFYNIRITLPAALAAGTAAREIAESKDEPYGTILTSTAGKKDDVDGSYAFQIISDSMIWSERLLDCKNIEDLHNTIKSNSPKGNLRVNCTFSHRQLGYSDKWLSDALDNSLSTGDIADRDFFNIWTAGSQSSPISPKMSEVMRESQILDYTPYMIDSYNYITRCYHEDIESFIMTRKFIMSIDTSEALGGDNDEISFIIRDVYTGGILAAGNYNETNLITFASWVSEWLIRFSTITAIIERRSTGIMVIDYITMMLVSKGIDPFKRLYNTIVQNRHEDPEKFKEISRQSTYMNMELVTKYKRHFGFATSSSGITSRSELYGTTFMNTIKLTADKTHDVKTIDQILGLVIKNGRIDHPAGGHDDMVIAWLLSFWLLTQGRGLDHYGIDTQNILKYNDTHKETNDPKVLFVDREQAILREEIEELVEKLQTSRDGYMVIKLENRLRFLADKLNDKDKAILSVDSLMDKLKEDRSSIRHTYR